MDTIRCEILKEIYMNNDFHIYAAKFNNSFEELSVKTDGFELCQGQKTLTGVMGTYQGQKSFICKYEEFDVNSKEAQKNLLMSIDGIKEATASLILSKIDDINIYRTDDYPQIKGIGNAKIMLIKEGLKKLDQMKIFKNVTMMLGGNFSPAVIKKVTQCIEVLDHGIEEFKEDPYKILIEMNDFSFKKADKIALSMGIKIDNVNRLKYLVEYIVKSYEMTGSCYIERNKLIEQLNSFGLNNIDFENNNRLVCDGDKIYTKSMFFAETMIPRHLNVLKNKKNVEKLDTYKIESLINKFQEINKIKFDSYQISAIKGSINDNVSIITGGAGCVDCDTEYFNGYEWKKISEYKKGDKVLQYNHFGNSELVYPIEYHKYKSDYLWYFKTKYGIDQCLSDEHNVFYITSKNNLYKKTFKEVRENHNKTSFKGKFITTFNYNGIGIKCDEWEIRLQIAIKADGSYYKDNDYCSINLKKERKKERIRLLLEKNNILYKESNLDNNYTRFSFNYKTTKNFGHNWYNCTKKQFEIIYNEIFYWDGDFINKKRWTTTIKKDADFIQFVGSVCGYRSYISINNRVGEIYSIDGKEYKRKSIEYNVSFSKNNLPSLCRDKRKTHKKTSINSYKTIDGYKYCFTVNSGKLILRRNNNIFITGNSGKTTLLKCVIFVLKEIGYRLFLTAPTGKASRRMSQATGEKATTIHRFLNESNDYYTTKNGVMIIDESSMIDTELLSDLLLSMDNSAIDFNKIIFVGDIGQLPSVQAGNILNDLIESNKFNVFKLVKTFRQSKDSNIIDIATSVRNNNDFEYIKKADFYAKEAETPSQYIDTILYFYEYLKSKYSSIDSFYSEVQFISPVKKGDVGVENINKIIKDKHNKKTSKDKFPFDINDKIMNTKNDKENDVYNGEFGRITNIDNTTFTVYYKELEKFITYKKDLDVWENFILSYCSTVHKLQGSEFKYIVIIIPQDSIILDSRLLYTAITRGKQTVILISNKGLTSKIVKRNNLLKRNTYLKERIENVEM
ncbi:MAG: AAA family ATPase [Spirochaetes bacterium]|nr:AAA family ATPase [Spirochaetota bacterium]